MFCVFVLLSWWSVGGFHGVSHVVPWCFWRTERGWSSGEEVVFFRAKWVSCFVVSSCYLFLFFSKLFSWLFSVYDVFFCLFLFGGFMVVLRSVVGVWCGPLPRLCTRKPRPVHWQQTMGLLDGRMLLENAYGWFGLGVLSILVLLCGYVFCCFGFACLFVLSCFCLFCFVWLVWFGLFGSSTVVPRSFKLPPEHITADHEVDNLFIREASSYIQGVLVGGF